MSQQSSNPRSASNDSLLAVSPIDGRYRARTEALREYFSEFALIRYRVRVEIEWYLTMAAEPAIDAVPAIDAALASRLRALYQQFALADAQQVKDLERTTNHDVKAVEYFLKDRFATLAADLPLEMIHFGCTSEDINNLSYALALKEFINGLLRERLAETVATLSQLAHQYKAEPMMTRTHGQHASPSTVGKEFAIFAARLQRQLGRLERQEYLGKFNGAVGNYNAHQIALPEADWITISRRFVEGLGLSWNPLTTQIESHDFIAEICDTMTLVDTILLDLARDLWGYVSLGYLRPRAVAGEVGSSTMPHKVNPIDFENCEGNVGIASALFQHLALKLPVSRWQRDLSDSTALRSLGQAFGHVMVALASLRRGLGIIDIDHARIAADLEDQQSFEVLAEAIQTLMRRHGLPRPYEALKELTRGKHIDAAMLAKFVDALPLDEDAKQALRRLQPSTYVGLAAELVERFIPPPSPLPRK